MNGEFTLGDLVLIEVALAQFFEGIDISMSAGQQVQKIIGKIEVFITKLEAAARENAPLIEPGKEEGIISAGKK